MCLRLLAPGLVVPVVIRATILLLEASADHRQPPAWSVCYVWFTYIWLPGVSDECAYGQIGDS